MQYKYHNINGAKFFTVSECLDKSMLELLYDTHRDLYDNNLYNQPNIENSACDENQTPTKNNLSVFLEDNILRGRWSHRARLLKETIEKQVDYCNTSQINYVFNNLDKDINLSSDSVYNLYHRLDSFTHMLSYYNEDYHNYNTHHDQAIFTFLMWFNFDNNFEGGNFNLTDFNLSLPALHNTGILFPGHYNHKVDSMKIKDKSQMGRLTYTLFKRT